MNQLRVDGDLVTRLTPLLLAVVSRYRIDREDQLDAVQDSWLLLLTNLNSIRDPAAVPTWLSTTASRRALRVVHQRHREVLWEQNVVDQQPVSGLSAERLCVLAERDRVLWEMVARLPEQERLLVELLAAEPGMTGRRLAARLGVSPSSAARIRARSLRRLRRMLTDAGIIGP